VLDAGRGWQAFEAFFGEDTRRMIERVLPGAGNRQNREDAYQAVCEALLKNDLQRLRAYSGRGSPSGFVLHTIENLVIDFVRTIIPRRRLPAAIQRLSGLDQSVYRLLYWDRLDADPAILLAHLSRPSEAPPNATAVAQAIGRVRQALPPGYQPRRDGQMVELSVAEDFALAGGSEDFRVPTPEDNLVEGQAADLLEQALDALKQALPHLAVGERLYLQLALSGEPAREIARLLCLPVEDVHKLAQKLKRRLRDELGDADVVRKWRLSV
jgi:RNA polymerase primary sigma factor